jgi:hypothetical protein
VLNERNRDPEDAAVVLTAVLAARGPAPRSEGATSPKVKSSKMTKEQEERLVAAVETLARERSGLKEQLDLLASALEILGHQLVTASTIFSSRP